MGKIVLLSPEVYNRIAAGEVIENPASVIKELIENSLDANADNIIVHIKDAGKKEITVIDNGEGMTEEDALLAIKKHTTSKIKTVEDLNEIKTFGFRGEALASIVSVAIVEIITKTSEMETAVKLFIENDGKKINKTYVSAHTGTTVKVLRLFYNTPARLKFLKSNNTEIRYIKDIFTAIALANPAVRFELSSERADNTIILHKQKTVLDRICEIFGEELRENLLYFESGDNFLNIRGYVSKPLITRPGSKNVQYLFLNKRPITAKYFNYWISEAYREFIPKGRYPFAFVYITASSKFVDVNVHPSKKEVRFLNEFFVSNRLINAIKNVLSQEKAVPEIKIVVPEKKEEIKESIQKSIHRFVQTHQEPIQKDYTSATGRAETFKEFKSENFFTLFNTYIFYEKDEDEVLVIDQHAAHERVIYERLKRETSKKKNLTQNLLIPLNITLSPSEIEVLKSAETVLRDIGFVFEEFGQNTIAIYGVPSYIRHTDDKTLFLDIITLLMENREANPITLKEAILKTMACKSAVKAGDYLNKEQKEVLIKQLLEDESRYTCPHGRPAVVKISRKEIEKWFKR